VWAFGSTGPLKLKPGFEPMVQAFSGLMMMNGDEGGPPTRIGTSILDYGTGMWTAMGALAGLVQRQRTGRGCVVDASLYETGLAWLKGHFASFRASGEVPERHRTGSQRVVPFQGFETKTGTIIVAAGNDRLFAKLAAVVGHPEWAKEERFATNAARVANKPALLALLEAIFPTRTKGEWIDLLEAGGVPCGPIYNVKEVFDDPHVQALGLAVTTADVERHCRLDEIPRVGVATAHPGNVAVALLDRRDRVEHRVGGLDHADETADLARRLRNRVAELFSVDAMVDGVLDAYQAGLENLRKNGRR
jgi:crotonobetainyl-CoA:carnitine CoA-transferase CaiB-like acyl-CoA transferase